MIGESRGSARNAEWKPRPTRAKVTKSPDRDFTKGREAGALKTRIGDSKLQPEQAGIARKYLALMDSLDAAQKTANNFKKPKDERDAATAEIKRIAALAINPRQDLIDGGIDVVGLNLQNKHNRKVFEKKHEGILKAEEPKLVSKASEIKRRDLVPGSAEQRGNAAIIAEYKKQRLDEQKRTEQQATETKNYLAAVERTNDLHAGLLKIRRELAQAKNSGSEDVVEKLTRDEADTTKAYAAGREKIKIAERSLKDAGIEPSDKRFATQTARDRLYAEKPTLKPTMESRREDRANGAEALEMGEDPSDAAEDVIGFLPGPDDAKDGSVRPLMRVNRGADGRVIRGGTPEMGNKDARPFDASEEAPDMIDLNSPKRAEEQRMREISAETKKAAAEQARVEALSEAQRLEESMLGKDFAMAKAAPAQKPAEKTGFFSRIAGFDVGSAARRLLLGLGIGLAAGKGVDTVRNHDQSPESAPTHQAYDAGTRADYSIRAETPAAPPAAQAVESGSADTAPAANVEISQPSIEVPSMETNKAVREFRKSGDPRNLEDALKRLEIFEGRDEYLRGRAAEQKAELQARLADLAAIRSVMSSKSPAVEASKRIDMEKRIAKAKARSEDMISYLELMRTIRSQ
ncbi:MAG: hypothetical protein WCO25_02470 [Candidatus Uhrbacteria bacterium]